MIGSVGCLCAVLQTKEIIEIAIPTLARRLEDNIMVEMEFLWETLGNIGCCSDEGVFKSIVNLILNTYKQTPTMIPTIGHTIARVPGRSYQLLAMYAEKALELFLEKAAVNSLVVFL